MVNWKTQEKQDKGEAGTKKADKRQRKESSLSKRLSRKRCYHGGILQGSGSKRRNKLLFKATDSTSSDEQ